MQKIKVEIDGEVLHNLAVHNNARLIADGQPDGGWQTHVNMTHEGVVFDVIGPDGEVAGSYWLDFEDVALQAGVDHGAADDGPDEEV